MSNLLAFSFGQVSVRTLGTPDAPMFVASDICSALSFTNSRKALADHVDPEDMIKVEINTNGGRQTVNCVNESGLYALIFGSKLESAKRFKRWVTTEVLPTIRKTGQYSLPVGLSSEDQYQVRKAIKARALSCSVHYQTLYNALYDYFNIASYKDLTHDQLKEALSFIESYDLSSKTVKALPPKDGVVFSSYETKCLMVMIYLVNYLFRPQLAHYQQFLETVHSPLASKFYDLLTDPSLGVIENALIRNGHDLKELDCFKNYLALNR